MERHLRDLLTRVEQVGLDAAIRAGELLRRRMGKIASIEKKGTFDYVTEVDRESQDLLVGMVQRAFPDHNILSEEEPASPSESEIVWIIDPLDGTTNFIHGIPMVAVSLAVCIEGETLFGLVYDPFREEQFVARKGQGASLNGRPLRVREGFPLSEALVATGFPFRAKHLIDPYMAAFKRIFHEVSDIRRGGSAALDLAYLAAGRLDGFWEIGLGPWDVAAGGLLIQEAGGRVSDFWGKPHFIQNGHIVAGTPSVYSLLMDHVRTLLAPSLTENIESQPPA